jgi:hypothetical protein
VLGRAAEEARALVCRRHASEDREQEARTQVHPERLALYQQSMQGKLVEPGRQLREEHAGAAEEGVQAGFPLKQAKQEHVSGKTGSNALQGNIASHVHLGEDQECFILY